MINSQKPQIKMLSSEIIWENSNENFVSVFLLENWNASWKLQVIFFCDAFTLIWITSQSSIITCIDDLRKKNTYKESYWNNFHTHVFFVCFLITM